MTRLLASFALATLLSAQRPLVEEAWELISKGDRDRAVQVLDRILSANPGDAEARILLGSIFSESGRFAEALPHLREAVRLRPRSRDAHYALSEALNAAGDRDSARAALEKTIELDPRFAPARADLGLILLESGDATGAAVQLDRAIVLLGRSAESAHPRYLRARIHTQQGEHEKALAALQTAVSLRPDFGEAWSDLGQAKKALHDDAGAFAAFQKAVASDPGNAISRYRLGAEYLRQDKIPEAIAQLEEANRLQPKDQSTLYSLVQALRKAGRTEEAARVRRQLAEVLRRIDTESQSAFRAVRLNNEGAELEKAGDLRGALEKYRAGLALDPEHAGIRVNFAVAALRLGHWREGLTELREALRRDPNNQSLKTALDDALEQAPVEFGGKGKAVVRPPAGR